MSRDILPLTSFKTLQGHNTPITALDFSEPYGTLVSASQEDSQPRVWDLLSGEEVGRLRGHRGTVKCLQVEENVCLTGGEDGNVRLWDLRKVDEEDDWEKEMGAIEEEEEGVDEMGNRVKLTNGNAIRQGSSEPSSFEKEGPCIRVLEGHSKAVTALYFESDCLVGIFTLNVHRRYHIPTFCSGHRRLRQDYAAMGPHHWSMCHDHGYIVGDLASYLHTGQHYTCAADSGSCRRRRNIRSTDTSIRGRNMGDVHRLRWRGAVLGLCSSEWQRRRRCTHVGQ